MAAAGGATNPINVINESAMGARQWIVVILMVLLNALDGFDVLSSAFASPGISAEWGIERAALGVVLSAGVPAPVRDLLVAVQHQLFDLGGELCIPGHAAIFDTDIARLEAHLDVFNADLPVLKEFILPGGGAAAAHCHLARTICRRAEREVVTLSHHDAVRPEAIRYLNRLSDLLFVLSRVLARAGGHGETLWNHERRKG